MLIFDLKLKEEIASNAKSCNMGKPDVKAPSLHARQSSLRTGGMFFTPANTDDLVSLPCLPMQENDTLHLSPRNMGETGLIYDGLECAMGSFGSSIIIHGGKMP